MGKRLPARQQMPKIALDNHYPAEGNKQSSATGPPDMCRISGMSCAVKVLASRLLDEFFQ